jgi:3'(2'), 5'-bisphosphate nucleotidase/myo-inositol-1(or 4)-monophosphatase
MIERLIKSVKEVGTRLLEYREQQYFEGHWEGAQFKAAVDVKAHQLLCSSLKIISPEIPVVSEEDMDSLVIDRPTTYWIIDPIDGTASFVGGYSGFVTQIALMAEDRPVAAVIYAPALDELYVAERGKGATLNNKPLRVEQNHKISTLIDNYPEPRGIALGVYRHFGFTKYMECGSISLKICKVADSCADVFIKNVPVRDWDLAAPHLVLEEAGGFILDVEGNEIQYKGGYEKFGLVAAASKSSCLDITNWYRLKIKGES